MEGLKSSIKLEGSIIKLLPKDKEIDLEYEAVKKELNLSSSSESDEEIDDYFLPSNIKLANFISLIVQKCELEKYKYGVKNESKGEIKEELF